MASIMTSIPLLGAQSQQKSDVKWISLCVEPNAKPLKLFNPQSQSKMPSDTVDGDEFLECFRPAEFEHRRLSSSKRLMRILGPIVLPAADFPAFEVADLPRGRAIVTQPVSDDDLGTAVALHGLLEESQGEGLVPRLADEELQRLTLVIDGPSKMMKLAVALHKNLVDVPCVDGPRLAR